jgi:hypothetical protein
MPSIGSWLIDSADLCVLSSDSKTIRNYLWDKSEFDHIACGAEVLR